MIQGLKTPLPNTRKRLSWKGVQINAGTVSYSGLAQVVKGQRRVGFHREREVREKRERQALSQEGPSSLHAMWFCEGRSRDANHCFRPACVASKSSGHRHTVQVGSVQSWGASTRLTCTHPCPGKEQEHTTVTPQFQECGQALELSQLVCRPGAWVTCRLLTCHSTTWKIQGLGNSFNSSYNNLGSRSAGPGSAVAEMTAKPMGGEKHHSLFV